MNATMIQFFHWYIPGDSFLWNHITEQAPYLAGLGITSAWLPPMYKGNSGSFSTGYDAYDLFDLGEFDQKGTIPTKYGSRVELEAACKTLKKNGIGVIADIVLNHKAGGDEAEEFHVLKVDPDDRRKILGEPFPIQSYTKFTFPGRGTKYSDFQWDFNCFTGVDYAEGIEGNAIYRIINEWGEDWDDMINEEKGNFDFLMCNDIETRNPNVRKELHYWGKWLHEQIGFDGVRLDAVKHIAPEFFKEWLGVLREQTGKDIFAVGEYWAPGDVDLLQRYLLETDGCMSVFDSALHHNFHKASEEGSSYDLRSILDISLMRANPTLAVTVVANHDTQPLQALEAPVAPWFKPLAYAIILLRAEGYPCVFYPDLYGTTYKDTGSDGEEYEIHMPKVEGIENLLKLRKTNAYGEQHDYFDDPNCIGFVRYGNDEHPGCAVIMSNGDAATKSMMTGKHYAGKTFVDALGRDKKPVTIREDGWADFSAPPGGVSVWIPQEKD